MNIMIICSFTLVTLVLAGLLIFALRKPSKEDIKKAIWLFRSSLTNKQPLYIIDDGNHLIKDNRNVKENEIDENSIKKYSHLNKNDLITLLRDHNIKFSD